MGSAVDFHESGAFEEEVEFFGEAVEVALGGVAGGKAGFGEGLVLDGGVAAVEEAADGGAVLGGEGGLAVEVEDGGGHGDGVGGLNGNRPSPWGMRAGGREAWGISLGGLLRRG